MRNKLTNLAENRAAVGIMEINKVQRPQSLFAKLNVELGLTALGDFRHSRRSGPSFPPSFRRPAGLQRLKTVPSSAGESQGQFLPLRM